MHDLEWFKNLNRFIGKHLVYTYENNWQYELYIRNENHIDYRIHSGLVAGRWMNKQTAYINRIAENIYKLSWNEPTGTFVSITVNLERQILHGSVCFPRWIIEHPKKTVCHQNEHIPLMYHYRDAGPTYEKSIEDNFAKISFMRDAGADDDSIINCPPDELPEGYPSNLKTYNLIENGTL